MATPQFINVGGGEMPLESIVPNTVNDVVIQTLTAGGKTVDSYQYIDWAGPDYDQTAWADGDGNIVSNVKFAPGQGLWIQGKDASNQIQTAGEVGTNDITIQLRFGFTAVGNPFPVAVSLQDIVANNVNTIVIQTLTAGGKTVDSYQYIDWAGPDYDQTAWADGDGNIVSDVEFAPGQGLWVQGASDSDAITFPAPEL